MAYRNQIVFYRFLDWSALFLYLFWVPLGSAPIYLSGWKVDRVLTLLAGFLMLLLLFMNFPVVGRKKIDRQSVFLVFSGLAYGITLFLSVPCSSAVGYSMSRFLIITGYMFAAFFVGFWFYNNLRGVSRLAFYLATMGAFLVVCSWLIFGMSSWGRMTLPTWTGNGFEYFPGGWGTSADPNILGCGLSLMWIFGLLSFGKRPAVEVGGSILVLLAILLTMSRTAILGLTLGVFVASMLFFLSSNVGGRRLKPKNILYAAILLMGSIGIGIYSGSFWMIYDRFTTISASNGRLQILQEVLIRWHESVKTIFIGHGFDMARITVDPHNIYLTALHDSGILGLVGMLFFILVLFFLSFRITGQKDRFVYWWLLFFITFSGMTYWHTKTFWVPVSMMVLIWSHGRWIKRRNGFSRV